MTLSAISRRLAASSFFRRPPTGPSARAAARPAEVRSRIIDRRQFDTVSFIASLLRPEARGRGLPVAGLWAQVLGSGIKTPFASTIVVVGDERATRALEAICQPCNGSRSLLVALANGEAPPVVARALGRQMIATDYIALAELRRNLDHIRLPAAFELGEEDRATP
jgi:hypothetical protein